MDVRSNPPRSFVHNLFAFPHLNGEGGCDTGQMLFKRKLIGKVRWRKQSAADHEFYKDVVFKGDNITLVRWLLKIGSIHNALR